MSDDWVTNLLVPFFKLAGLVIVGWPEGRHGPLRRRPVAEVASVDRWDRPLEA